MSSSVLQVFIQYFEKILSSPSDKTVYNLIAMFALLFLTVNILIVYVYPNKDKYPLRPFDTTNNDDNPWTGRLQSILLFLQVSLLNIASFLYLPWFYYLPQKFKSSLYDVFVYCANLFTLELLLIFIGSFILLINRYPVTHIDNGGHKIDGYCPLTQEDLGSGDKSCSRSGWERILVVITNTIRNFTESLRFSNIAGMGGDISSSYVFFPLMAAVTMYIGGSMQQ
jgi:hypothetical protein